MSDAIYIVSPNSGNLSPVEQTTFTAIGVKEVGDLEQWVLKNPKLLGEDLLVITSEFDHFDRSRRRLDVLALDREGKLVVVELKLEVERTFADLQSIRYAAFCSTMTIDQLVETLAAHDQSSTEEATAKIQEFIGTEELPELDNRPRIIIAASSMDDLEIASTVLWLRTFEVDITCVELSPYKFADTGQVLIVPRIIIPLPEAKDYVVSVERKESAKARSSNTTAANRRLWRTVADAFNDLGTGFSSSGRSGASYQTIPIGFGWAHYEWMFRKSPKCLFVAFHAESKDRETNLALIKQLEEAEELIMKGIEYSHQTGAWGRRWAHFQIGIPYSGDVPSIELARPAAELMKTFIERTWPTLQKALEG